VSAVPTVSPPVIAGVLFVTLVVLVLGLAALRDSYQRERVIRESAAGVYQSDQVSRWRRRLNARVRRTQWGHRLDRQLAGATLALGPGDFAVLVAAAALLLAVISRPLLGNIGAVVLAAAVVVVAGRWLDRRRRRRVEAFVAQLPDLARVLSNAASAGLALRTAIDLAAREMPEPASVEFAEVSRQLALGQSLDDALEDLRERLPSRELAVLIQTLVIQSRAGGALVSALVNIAATLDSRKELRREIRTAVSGALFGGYTVVGIGVGSVLVMNLITPGALDRLSQTLPGQLVIAVSGALFVLGFVLIRKITDIEI
jgi:tight adherence protein B